MLSNLLKTNKCLFNDNYLGYLYSIQDAESLLISHNNILEIIQSGHFNDSAIK